MLALDKNINKKCHSAQIFINKKIMQHLIIVSWKYSSTKECNSFGLQCHMLNVRKRKNKKDQKISEKNRKNYLMLASWKYSSTKECNSLGLSAQYLCCWRWEKFLMKNLGRMFSKYKDINVSDILYNRIWRSGACWTVQLEPLNVIHLFYHWWIAPHYSLDFAFLSGTWNVKH